MLFYVFRSSIYAANVFMIACNPVDAVFCLKFFQIFPEVSPDNRIHFSIEYIAGEEYEVRLEIIYLPNYTLYIYRSIDRGEMDVTGYGYSDAFLYTVFFLQGECVSVNCGCTSVDITDTEEYERRYERYPGCIIGYLLHARVVDPVGTYVYELENIKTYTDKEKMHHAHEPE